VIFGGSYSARHWHVSVSLGFWALFIVHDSKLLETDNVSETGSVSVLK
jgi:hypothetical protein